ncbi:CHASE2 domain-containing protein [Pacificispira sp.]|uniref:CHASE2 domain-containing protein n=1 Tax=Pacificispira sp. TaxID=2888761 RepID=UPI003BAB6017
MSDTVAKAEPSTRASASEPEKSSIFSRLIGGKKKNKKRKGGKWWKISLPSALGLFIIAVSVLLRQGDPYFIEVFRLKTFDLYNRIEPRVPLHSPSSVVIADIDEKSLAEIGQWPWPRTVIGDLIAALGEYEVYVVGFDVVFAEPDRTSPQNLVGALRGLDEDTQTKLQGLPSNEAYMSAAMRRAATVLGQAGKQARDEPSEHPEIALKSSSNAAIGEDPKRFLIHYPGLITNVDELEEAAMGRGFFSIADEVDGIVRRIPIVAVYNDVVRPALSVEMLRVATRGNTIFTVANQAGIESVRLQTPMGKFDLPTDGQGRFWVHFAEADTYNTENNDNRLYISASDIINKRVPPERLKHKFVLVGTSAVGLQDIRNTPVAVRMPGVEVHANVLEIALESLEGVPRLHYPPIANSIEMFVVIVLGLMLIFFIPRVGPFWTLLGLVTIAGGAAVGSWILFSEHKVLIDVAYPGATILALYAVLAFSNYARDAAEKRQVRGAFSQYLSPDLVEQLAEDPEKLKLGGETKRMTLLFCDVRGFTTISEQYKADPQGLTVLINRLLTPLTEEILNRQGTIDKYMGDCIMAFWNAPLDVPNQEQMGVASALAMFESLEALNEERKREALEEDKPFLPLNIGIGLNTGDCVVGNMGSKQRFDYSVLGDAVNLAARLEGQSKSYGVGIVIGEETAGALNGVFPMAELDLIAVKGKSEAVRIFTVLGKPDLLSDPDYAALQSQHAAMLDAYRGQQWDEANRIIQTCIGRLDGVLDGFYGIYQTRIEEYRDNPPPVDWDGVYVATTK